MRSKKYIYGQSKTDGFWILRTLASPSNRGGQFSFDALVNSGINRYCPKKVHNLANILSQMRSYAREIAFTRCNPGKIHVGARLDSSNAPIRMNMTLNMADTAQELHRASTIGYLISSITLT